MRIFEDVGTDFPGTGLECLPRARPCGCQVTDIHYVHCNVTTGKPWIPCILRGSVTVSWGTQDRRASTPAVGGRCVLASISSISDAVNGRSRHLEVEV